jgi:electron transport complex protein RnfG
MTEIQTIPQNTNTSSMPMLRAMVGIGALCALLIVLTFEGTLPRIERLKAEALEKAIFRVLPGTVATKTFLLDQNNGFTEVSAKDAAEPLVYAGYDQKEQLTGVAVEASGQGYADVLRILYGYHPDKQAIIGFYVLESKETPGLGDKIEKDADFLANFEALDVSLTDDLSELKNVVVPVKQGAKERPWQVDGITGATISSRAIGNIIGTSTQNWVPLIYNNQKDFTSD